MPELDPEEVLAKFPKALLPCKGDQHAWSRNYSWDQIDPQTLEREQVCRDCKLFRHTLVDRYTGARLTDYGYRGYPREYRTPGLRKADFQQRLNQESIAKAIKTGKVHGAPDPQLEEKRQAREAG